MNRKHYVTKPGRAATTALLAFLLSLPLSARKFYPDDPIWKEPEPRSIGKAKGRKLSEYYDFFHHTLFEPGERHPKARPIPAQGVNTLGEVPDSTWYVNRHWLKPMTIEELRAGPGNDLPPSTDGSWKIVAAKTEGVTPGFTIEDSAGRRYMLKFDPLTNLEMASAAEVVGSKFFYALGYHVPESYIVYFDRSRLVVAPDVTITDADGKHRRMDDRDVGELLLRAARDADRGYRAVASRYLSGKNIGPFRYFGTRRDDPNDVVPHEHRRDLRGLFVFAAWLGHNDIKCLNTLDMLVEERGVRYIKHYLIDFGASLGSDSFMAKSPRAGNQYLFAWRPSAVQFFTFGLVVPRWARADYPDLPSVGHFESKIFEPEKWKPNYPVPPFDNRLPDDTFWAAKQVMTFTDEQIRAIVNVAQYSNPAAEEWITKCLIQRRDKIGRTYFAKVLPLDRFEVKGDRLEFVDLAAKHGFSPARSYKVQWSRFDNEREQRTPLASEDSFTFPREARTAAAGEYFAADIQGEDPKKTVTVYVRKESDRIRVVGIDRTW